MDIAILSIFGLALAAPSVQRVGGARTGWLLAMLPAGLFVYFILLAGQVADGDPVTISRDWVPALGITFGLYLDGLSLVMALLVTGIGALVLVYAGGYLAGHDELGRFYAFLLVFMGSMLGLVLADNIFLLFVFWELTSISSYLLIGFDHESADARAAALQALLVTNAGGMAMLAGFVLLGQVADTPVLSSLAVHGDTVRGDSLYLPILLLILAGAFTKSAQFPFHFWLPSAMAAPTPVSAYLHSATMVKAGIYLLARLSPTIGGTEEWTAVVTTVGVVTMLTGGLGAFVQTDLKRLLAYSTVSALGSLVMLLGLGTPVAATGAIVFLVAHALYKGALFMAAGAIDHESGTRDVRGLGGLWRAMPVTAAVAALAAVSLAGFGPLLSFVGKELMLEAVLESRFAALLAGAVVVAGALFALVAGLVAVRPFLGATRATPRPAHEPPASLLLGPAVLAVLGIALGVAPGFVEEYLGAPAAAAVLGRPTGIHLALWHGLNPAFGLSLLSLALGAGLYIAWAPALNLVRGLAPLSRIGPGAVYGGLLLALEWIAQVHTRFVQNGYLRAYLAVTVVTAAALGLSTLARADSFEGPGSLADVHFYHVGLAAVMLVAAALTAVSPSRLAAVASLGVVGYGVALIYILFGAPDLAMTQFMVETLTVILFLAVFYHLPRLRTLSRGVSRFRDAAIALAAGAFMTALVLVASTHRTDSALATYYGEQSVPLGHGRNIVNVILVDFRALDTLGEITVLAVAAFGVYALLKLRPRDGTSGMRHSPPPLEAMEAAPAPDGDGI